MTTIHLDTVPNMSSKNDKETSLKITLENIENISKDAKSTHNIDDELTENTYNIDVNNKNILKKIKPINEAKYHDNKYLNTVIVNSMNVDK